MEETQRLLTVLKRQLHARGITYATLGRHIGLSESSVKRVLANGRLTLPRLERICTVIRMSVTDLVRSAAADKSAAPSSLSLEQERLLAGNSQLLACFYLLLNGRTPDECAARLELSKRVLTGMIERLGAAGLVAGKRGVARVVVRPPVMWRPDGPVRKLYERQVRAEFMQSEFKARGESLAFHSAELSPASLQLLARKIEVLNADFAELARLDAALSARDKKSVAMLIASRPWVFSMFSDYHTQKPGR
ncbi:MAG: helix-turn-helix transcriptional regulator [Steroidobacteraceae bacterium]